MNAYEAMVAILDINETIEALKKRYNTEDSQVVNLTGKQDLIKSVELLTKYRELLIAEMEATTLEVFKYDDQ